MKMLDVNNLTAWVWLPQGKHVIYTPSADGRTTI